MELVKRDYAAAGLFVAMVAVTVYGWVNISGQVAIHFGPSGTPNSFASKAVGLLLIPAVSALLYGLFRAIPSIDPLGENIGQFEEVYDLMIVSVLGFLVYIQGVIVAWNLGWAFNVTTAIAPAVAGLYYVVGVLLENADRNWFVGIRTPWTMSSEEVWDRTHERTAPLFKISAVIALLGVFFEGTLVFVVAPVVGVAAFSFVYSYLLYQRLE